MDNTNIAPIIATLPVEAEGENKSAVVNVTQFYVNDQSPVPAGQGIGGGADPGRSYLERIKAFPLNIEAHVVVTFNRGANPITTTVHHSLVMLPEKPMTPRYFDSRVGYFTESYSDYGSSEHRVVDREVIARYRLEKKDPKARISDPVKPIVFYVSREVPDEWRGYIHQAIEDWQPAFEQAGFSHAIIAKDPPSEAEDPELGSGRRPLLGNPVGGTAHRKRHGPACARSAYGRNHLRACHRVAQHAEACGAVVLFAVRVPRSARREAAFAQRTDGSATCDTSFRMRWATHWAYATTTRPGSSFTIAAASEPRLYRAERRRSIHHGLRPIQLCGPARRQRALDPEGRPVRIASPSSGVICPCRGLHRQRPSSLRWTPLRRARSPIQRCASAVRNRIAQVDPTVQMEDLSNDPIAAGTLGFKNIERIIPMVVPATTKFGEDYDQLQDVYNHVLMQRTQELLHVVKLVGGVVETRYHAGRGQDVFSPVPRAEQARAVQFLLAGVFVPHPEIYPESDRNKIQYTGVADRILNEQNLILLSLLKFLRVSAACWRNR